MDPVRLSNFIAGIDRSPVPAGRLDAATANAIGADPGIIVWLSEYTLLKNQYRHPEIGFREYQIIPEVISVGFVIRGKRPNMAEIGLVRANNLPPKGWLLVLKKTVKPEVFAVTFQPLHIKEARRMYRRALRTSKLARDAKNELARRLLRRASFT